MILTEQLTHKWVLFGNFLLKSQREKTLKRHFQRMNSESDITPFQGLLGENVTVSLSSSLEEFL